MANVTLNSAPGDQRIFVAVEHGGGCSDVQIYCEGEELNVVVGPSRRGSVCVSVDDTDVYRNGVKL